MSNNTKYVRDAFKSLELVEDKEFDLFGDDSFEELDDYIKGEEEVETDKEVIDLEAESEEELKDSYVGDAILSCPVCRTNLFKPMDDVIVDDETKLCCAGEACPVCAQEDGFKVIGKVAPFEDAPEEEDKLDVEVETEPEEEETELEVKEKVHEAKKRIKGKKLQEKIAKRVGKGKLAKGKKLTEGLSVSEVEKFLENSIKSIKEDPSVTARYVLDDDLCLYVGYEGGFDADETGSDERICAKIAEKNDYYWVDFEAMNQPWDPETGDVWDTDSEVSPSDAKYYVDEYKAIRKALDKGEVVLESKKSPKGKKLTEAPIYDLNPRYDSRASFYGKAKVDTGDKNDQNKLYSYNTLVAEIKDGKPVVYGTYSQTTLRHIKDWLKQNGFKAENSKQILADYGVKDECVNESATLQEKRWKYKLKSGSELRAAIEEAQEEETEESYQAIFEALKVCIDELRDVITEKNGFDEDDFSWNFDDILEDLEYMDADEDNIDYLLDKFYDSCDGLGIWINLTNESLGKKNLKEAYDKNTTFEEWFNDINAKNPADWKKRFYPFDKYSKTFGVESLRNATADDIVKHAHEFYDVYDVDSSDRELAFSFASDVTGRDYDDFYNAWLSEKPLVEEKLTEDIEKATIETEDQVIEVSTEPKDENMNADWQAEGGELLDDVSGDEMIAPLDDTDINEIEANSEEKETAEEPVEEPAEETEEETEEETTPEDEEEFDFDEIQEESFKRITESYLKKVYSNVKSFKINSAELKESLLTINGTIEFNSGKTKDTSFVFESKNDKTTIAKSKRRFVGLNETITDKKNAYVLSTSLQGKKLVAESLRYDYPAKTSNLTEGVKTVKGFIK